MKKKICIITSSYPSNKNDSKNAGVFVREFALLLAKENFDVSVLAPSRKNAQNDDPSLNVHFFPWMTNSLGLSSHNSKNPIHFLKLISLVISGVFFTLRFLKNNNIDHCIAMWAVPSGFFTLIAKIFQKTPFSVWALGSDIWQIQNYPFGKIILKKVLKNADNLFADGIKLKQDVQKISNKTCEFLPSSRILDKTIIEINYPKFDPTKTNFMFLGRYHTNKGIDLLIDAIRLLSIEEKQKSLFHIFGGGPLDNTIKQKVKNFNLNDIVYVNDYLDSSHVFSYMTKSDYFIIPSRIESIPVVLSDAMHCKIPVLVTDVGDMGFLVKKYDVGIVVDSTSEDISKGIKSLLNERKKINPDGIEQLKKYLNLSNSVQIFLEHV